MSKNIKLGNNTLTGVDIIKVQDSVSGLDSFIDSSDSNATASDIRNGKIAYTSTGRVVGTASLASVVVNQDNSIDIIIS